MNLVWTPERAAHAIELYRAGISTREIGERLRVSKNQIVGMLWRNGLVGIGNQAPIKTMAERLGEDRVPTGCRWIFGDPPGPDWRWCNAPQANESSYCAKHHAEAWRTS